MEKIACWIWPWIAGIAGLIIGWLLKSIFKSNNDWESRYKSLEADYSNLQSKESRLQDEYNQLNAQLKQGSAPQKSGSAASADWQAKLKNLEDENAQLKTKLSECTEQANDLKTKNQQTGNATVSGGNQSSNLASNSLARSQGGQSQEAQAQPGSQSNSSESKHRRGDQATGKKEPAQKDDLKKVEGIGPKVAEVLNENGIYTYADLADTPHDKIKSMLSAAGPRFQLQNPRSWPDQAVLFREGKKDELKKLQDYLIRGIYPEDLPEDERQDPDDLKKIEGIGPKVQEALNESGIYTYKKLSETGVDMLQDILDHAGSRFRLQNPQTWPEQAALCRDGKWDVLKDLQSKLKGGVRK